VRRILITGCGGGLGEALMNESRKRGHKVFPHYRRGGSETSVLTGILTDYSFVERFNSYMQINNVDTFINNAGQYLGGPIGETSDESIKTIIDTNVTAQILLMKKAFKRFKSMKSGLIININSLAYQQPSANETIYCATKFALKGFSKALQMEAIGTGVEIIDVHPGGIQTGMTSGRPNYDSLMKREDVASQVVNLIDRGSSYTNEIILRKRNESSRS
jgi:short-subunit dehydrogenase